MKKDTRDRLIFYLFCLRVIIIFPLLSFFFHWFSSTELDVKKSYMNRFFRYYNALAEGKRSALQHKDEADPSANCVQLYGTCPNAITDSINLDVLHIMQFLTRRFHIQFADTTEWWIGLSIYTRVSLRSHVLDVRLYLTFSECLFIIIYACIIYVVLGLFTRCRVSRITSQNNTRMFFNVYLVLLEVR